MKKTLLILLLFISFNLTYAQNKEKKLIDLNQYHFLAEISPPVFYEEGNKYQGIAAELLSNIFEDLKLDKSINGVFVGPWDVVYQKALKTENYVVFSTNKTKERDNLFKWVGPIAPSKVVLLGLSKNNIDLSDISKISNYKIGAIHDDIGELLVNNLPIQKKHLVVERDFYALLKMLANNEIDFIAYDQSIALWRIKALDKDLADYKSFYTLEESNSYFAFNIKTPNEVIEKFQNSLENVKKSKYQNISSSISVSNIENITFDEYLKKKYLTQ